jgi:hypothetical protein
MSAGESELVKLNDDRWFSRARVLWLFIKDLFGLLAMDLKRNKLAAPSIGVVTIFCMKIRADRPRAAA